MKFGLQVFLSIISSAKQTAKNFDTTASKSYTTTEVTQSFETTFAFTSYTDVPAKSDENEYQYVFIGVYALFVTIFAVTIILICGGKIKKACCDRHPENETVPYETTGNIQDENSVCGNAQVVIDDALLENTVGVVYDDDEYDYYSMDPDRMEETRNLLLDKPPPYDNPPPYSPV